MTQTEMQETEGAVAAWIIRGVVIGGIGAVGNASITWNNGGSGWTVVRAAGIGFADGATGGCGFKMARQQEVVVSRLRDFALNSMILMICLIVSAYLTSGSISVGTAAILMPIAVVGGVACTILFRKLGA
jgi:hypothetical protein